MIWGDDGKLLKCTIYMYLVIFGLVCYQYCIGRKWLPLLLSIRCKFSGVFHLTFIHMAGLQDRNILVGEEDYC